ncbi:SIMPL domain-containing protein, partial [Acidithiobacillus thiooxidans]
PNTLMVAQLQASATGPNAADLGQKVNAKMRWALQQTGKADHVQAQTMNYHTQRDYVDGKPDGWTVQQTLQVSAPQSSRLDQLLGDLQSRLELVSMQAAPTESARESAATAAAHQAIQRFKQRANNFCKDFGYAQSVLNSVQINTLRSSPGPVMMMAARTPVASAPGESAMSVEVSGSVHCLNGQ